MNRPWMDFGRHTIMGVAGAITCNWDGRYMRCVDCTFHVDAGGLDWEQLLQLVAEHHQPHWFGYAKYTNRPERPVGRRIA